MKPSRLARLHAATDRQSGERVLIKPQAAGGYVVGLPDPERPEATVVAYIARASGLIDSQSAPSPKLGAAVDDLKARIRFSADTIKFKTSDLPYKVVDGDIVRLIDQPGAPIVRVSRAAPFGTDRTVLYVVGTSRP